MLFLSRTKRSRCELSSLETPAESSQPSYITAPEHFLLILGDEPDYQKAAQQATTKMQLQLVEQLRQRRRQQSVCICGDTHRDMTSFFGISRPMYFVGWSFGCVACQTGQMGLYISGERAVCSICAFFVLWWHTSAQEHGAIGHLCCQPVAETLHGK